MINQHNYIAFDLEIYKIVPGDFNDWRSHRPLGISCAATCSASGVQIWYGKDPAGGYADFMSRAEAAELVEYLLTAVQSGATLLTWNGLNFDFDLLAEESDQWKACQELALNHVDMMFQVVCAKGYPLGLDKAAKGMGLPGKTAGMSGDQAPVLWQAGRRAEVLEYVSQDVQTTLDLALQVEQARQLRWISNSGRPQVLPLPRGWLRVREAMQLPEPDNAWMRNPLRREDFVAWMR